MKISIIVCTRNRAERLTVCLNAIEAAFQASNNPNTELLIVNNNSSDNTLNVISEWKKENSIALSVVTENKLGISNARSRGLIEASGDLLVFIDDDCLMHKNYLSEIRDYYGKDDEPVLRMGAVHFGNHDDWPITIFPWKSISSWKKQDKNSGYPHKINIYGCNMAIPREIHKKIGAFDKRFGTPTIPSGEDTDYGFRVFHAGFRLENVPGMIVYHYHGRNNLEKVTKLVKNYSIGSGALYAKHLWRHTHVLAKLTRKKWQPFQRDFTKETQNLDRNIALMFKHSNKEKILGFFMYYIESLKALAQHTSSRPK